MGDLYIGLMSGTSMDGVDAALVRFGDRSVEVLATLACPYPEDVRVALRGAMHAPGIRSATDVPDLHLRIGECFRQAASALLTSSGVDRDDVIAIGSHGQTIRHEPSADEPFSLQIGDAGVIAEGLGITTVFDFRSADIALGGEGAPLAPAFHEWLFRQPGETRLVVNIGGISNITVLPGDDTPTTGYDTGPGNTLLDAWVGKHRGEPYDRNGDWSASGTVDSELLARLLDDPYFAAAPPKSTGFEYFNLAWLESHLTGDVTDADIQATLCALTAESIATAIRAASPTGCDVLLCGGGVHNADLVRRIGSALPGYDVVTTAAYGLDPDWIEAVAFAWLAMQHVEGRPGNLPAVTGARAPAVLGEIRHPG